MYARIEVVVKRTFFGQPFVAHLTKLYFTPVTLSITVFRKGH